MTLKELELLISSQEDQKTYIQCYLVRKISTKMCARFFTELAIDNALLHLRTRYRETKFKKLMKIKTLLHENNNMERYAKLFFLAEKVAQKKMGSHLFQSHSKDYHKNDFAKGKEFFKDYRELDDGKKITYEKFSWITMGIRPRKKDPSAYIGNKF
ncbi:MAG: hypothetical protein GY730_01905 [bacterium]|nr:hypothetical protein [bacterium]